MRCHGGEETGEVQITVAGGGREMAKQPMKSGKNKDTRSRKVRDLPAKPVGRAKAASVEGGEISIPFTKIEWKYK